MFDNITSRLVRIQRTARADRACSAAGSRRSAALMAIALAVGYSTVTVLARLRGWSTSHPRHTAMW